jgi:hypothetical protein
MSALHGALTGQAGATLRAAGVLAAIGLAAATVAAWRIGHGWGRSKLL